MWHPHRAADFTGGTSVPLLRRINSWSLGGPTIQPGVRDPGFTLARFRSAFRFTLVGEVATTFTGRSHNDAYSKTDLLCVRVYFRSALDRNRTGQPSRHDS